MIDFFNSSQKQKHKSKNNNKKKSKKQSNKRSSSSSSKAVNKSKKQLNKTYSSNDVELLLDEIDVDTIERNNTTQKKSARELDRERLKQLNKSKKSNKKKKAGRKVPRTTIQSIPYKKLDKYNITQLENELFSRTYSFEDINYHLSKVEDQETLLMQYVSLLNSFDSVVDVQIDIVNEKTNHKELKKAILLRYKDDDVKEYREEYNKILSNNIENGKNNVVSKKYITLVIKTDDIDVAKNKFDNIETELINSFNNLGSSIKVITNKEKVRILTNIYRGNNTVLEDIDYNYNKSEEKSYLAPDYIEYKPTYFMYGSKYARSLFLRDIPSYLKDSFVSDLTDRGLEQLLTINIETIETEKAMKIINKQITAMKSNRISIKKRLKSTKSVVDSDDATEHITEKIEEAQELLKDLTGRNQKMFLLNMVVTVIGNSFEELEANTEAIMSIARKNTCEFSTLVYQQEDGFSSSLPIGNNKLDVRRTLTTESTAIFLPFNVQSFLDYEGSFYGVNPVTKNIILLRRDSLNNYNCFIIGTSGSGKSFFAKKEIFKAYMSTNDEIIIIDPQSEYVDITNALNGEVVVVSPTSNTYINPMEFDREYKDNIADALRAKSDFILTFFTNLVRRDLKPSEKSIIDRIVNIVYVDYIQSDYEHDKLPTLVDFHDLLMQQEEVEAKRLALDIELYIKGSLNIFAHKSNVNTNNRIVNFNVQEIGKNLKTVGMLIVMDFVWNRVISNFRKGIKTWVYIDEMQILLKDDLTADFCEELFKTVRKFLGYPNAITQNVEQIMLSNVGRLMLSNSEFVVMLGQSSVDADILAQLYDMSDSHQKCIRQRKKGKGIISYGGTLIPFEDEFPKDTKMYRIMSTSNGELKVDDNYEDEQL